MIKVWRHLVRPLAVVLAAGMLFTASSMPVMAAQDMADEDVADMRSSLLDTPEKLWWSSPTVARWKSVKAASQYHLKLYEYGGAKEAVLTVKVTSTSYDFADVMKDGGQYYFMVRSIPKVSEQQIKTASNWTASEEGDPVSRGITSGKWRNYLEGSRYELEDGSFAANGWLLIAGQWYYFSDTGYAVTNTWLDWSGYRYFLSENGSLKTGWMSWNSDWYYFDMDGVMQTGWVNGETPNQWYYLNADGTMAYDTVIDGYTLDSSGLVQ